MGFLRNISDLITEVRQTADMENTQFVTDTEIVKWLNNAYRRMYNLLIEAYENYKVSPKDLTTVANQTQYTLETDFLKLLKVFFVASDGREVPLIRIPMQEMGRYSRVDNRPRVYCLLGDKLYLWPVSAAGVTIRYYYVPAATVFTSATTNVDFAQHMDEYCVIWAAVKCLIKEKTPCNELINDREKLELDCIRMANPRDASEAQVISDVVYSRSYEQEVLWD
jgi:hypothetical protein